VRHARLREQLLRGAVLLREQQRGGVGPGDAGVGDELHTGGLGGRDRVGVLAGALPDHAAGDQEQLLRPGEGLAQRHLVVEVRAPDDDAALGEIGQGLRPASGGDDLVGRDAAVQEGLDDEAAEVAGGAGDDDRHGHVLLALTEVCRVHQRLASSNWKTSATLPVGE
jgi:hypothetical protein